MIKLKCIKSLYKSTYKGNAFDENKEYELILIDGIVFYLLDNKRQEFSMTKNGGDVFYDIESYFDLTPVNKRIVLFEKQNQKYNNPLI